MKVTLLGTGTSQGIPVIGCPCPVCHSNDPRDQRLRCSLLASDHNINVVVDVGPDFRTQMITHRVDRMHAVFLTHEHNDHIIGLDDLRPFIFRSRSPMKIYGEERVLNDVRSRFKYAFGESKYPGAPNFDLIAIEPGAIIELGNLSVEALRVYHGGLPILSYKLNNLAYLTDVSAIDPETFDKIKDVDVLIISALRREKHHSHFNMAQAIEASLAIGAKKTFLIHMSHRMGLTQEWEEELPDNVEASYDGMVIKL